MRRRSMVLILLAGLLLGAVVLRSCGDSRHSMRESEIGTSEGRASAGSPRQVDGLPRNRDLEASAGMRHVAGRGADRQREDDSGGSSTWEGAATLGIVHTEDGMAVSGALVVLGDLDSSDDTALTGTDGRFAIDTFPSYSTLHAFAVRDDSVWHGEVPADGGPFDWTVTLSPTKSAIDRVVLVHVVGPEGRPIPRGRAEAIGGSAREPWRSRGGNEKVVAVAGGWFPVAARRWREGEVPVFLVGAARDDKGQALPHGTVLVRVDPAGSPVVEARLPFGAVVSGWVEFPDGRPARATRITFDGPVPEGFVADGMTHPSPETAITDAAGHFSFGGNLEGEGTLFVEAAEGVHGGSAGVEVVIGGPEVVVRLRDPLRGSDQVPAAPGR